MLSLPDAELHVEVVEEPGEDPKMVKISDVELGDVVRHRANHANKHGVEVRDKV